MRCRRQMRRPINVFMESEVLRSEYHRLQSACCASERKHSRHVAKHLQCCIYTSIVIGRSCATSYDLPLEPSAAILIGSKTSKVKWPEKNWTQRRPTNSSLLFVSSQSRLQKDDLGQFPRPLSDGFSANLYDGAVHLSYRPLASLAYGEIKHAHSCCRSG